MPLIPKAATMDHQENLAARWEALWREMGAVNVPDVNHLIDLYSSLSAPLSQPGDIFARLAELDAVRHLANDACESNWPFGITMQFMTARAQTMKERSADLAATTMMRNAELPQARADAVVAPFSPRSTARHPRARTSSSLWILTLRFSVARMRNLRSMKPRSARNTATFPKLTSAGGVRQFFSDFSPGPESMGPKPSTTGMKKPHGTIYRGPSPSSPNTRKNRRAD